MQLPDDIIHHIREYSRPLTRPDWKRILKLPHAEFGLQLFIGTCKAPRASQLCMTTFAKSCYVLQDRLQDRPRMLNPVQPIPQFCAFHGNGCTTKSKTKRRCSKTCPTQVCMYCKNCHLHC